MNVLGLDLSLTAPGVAYGGTADTLRAPKDFEGVNRLRYWRDVFVQLFRGVGPNVVVLEGYSFGSHDTYARAIAELGGVVRLILADGRVPYAEVSPASLKKYAAGKGNAKKEAVTMAAVHRGGREFPDNNAADAWWLFQMGLAHYAPTDPRYVPMPVENRGALVKVNWPAVMPR
jgi:Holliday junction resolvasome RuvABC endonuclease subunit